MKNQYTPSIAHFSNTLSAKNSSISTVFIVLAFGLVFVPFANKRDAISVKYYTGLIGLQPVISNEDTLFPAGASIHLVITTFSDGSREIYNVEQRNRIMVNSAGFSKESSAKFIFNTSYIEVNGYLSPTQTIKLYENVPLKEDPIKQEEGYFIAGKNYYNRGDYVKAVENFNNAIAYNSKNGEYYTWLGNSLRKLERFDEAILKYNAALSLNPENKEAYFGLGNCYYNKKDYEKARENFENATKWDKSNSEYYTWLAKSLFKLKRDEEAMNRLELALKLNDKNDEAIYYLGQVYFFGMNDTANAVIYWKKSMELGNQQGKQNYEWWLKLQK